MRTRTVVFDVDGVLANFMDSAVKIGHEIANKVPPSDHVPQTWDDYGGLTESEITKLWMHIATHPEFWYQLKPLASGEEFDAIHALIMKGHRVYFATNRRMPGSLNQTVKWLEFHINAGSTEDFVTANVIITKRKGEFCKVVDADFYIDDKSENVDCAIWFTDGVTKAYVIDRPTNRGAGAPHSHKAGRVKSVTEFLEEVNRERR